MEENKTTELEKIEPTKVTLMIHGKEREIKFGFSAWAKLEKEYNGVNNLEKMQKDIEDNPFTKIPHLLYIGLVDKSPFKNENGELVELTEENILDEYGIGDIPKITEIFSRALYGSIPTETLNKKAGDEKKSPEMEALL